MHSGFGLGPLTNPPPSLKFINRTPRLPWTASEAMELTEKSDKSVVTLSCDGERSIRHATVKTGVCGGGNLAHGEGASTLEDAI